MFGSMGMMRTELSRNCGGVQAPGTEQSLRCATMVSGLRTNFALTQPQCIPEHYRCQSMPQQLALSSINANHFPTILLHRPELLCCSDIAPDPHRRLVHDVELPDLGPDSLKCRPSLTLFPETAGFSLKDPQRVLGSCIAWSSCMKTYISTCLHTSKGSYLPAFQ